MLAFNIHFPDYPYQPCRLAGIRYGPAPYLTTGTEAVHAARAARAAAVTLLLEDLKSADGADVVFVFGDFNEPSHRDSTERAAHPDEVSRPGHTWEAVPRPAEYTVRHDRIDNVFARGAGLFIEQVRIAGEKAPEADLVVEPWPPDHRAVVATVRFQGERPHAILRKMRAPPPAGGATTLDRETP